MKVRSGRFFFVSIVCMFVLAIGVFVGGVWIQYSRGRENALVEFRAIVQKAAAVFAQGAGDASAVKSGMDIIFASYPDLAAATVQINGKAVFAQQKSTGFLSMTPSGEPVITASSPMLITQSAPFTTGNGTPAFISALVYVMRPVSVYRVACVSFVIILTATIFAIIVVFLPHAQAEDSPEAEAPKPAPPREAVPAQAARCEAPPGVTEPPAARPEGERQPEEAPAEEGQAGAPQGDNPPVWESIPAPKTEGFSPESLLEARLGEELAAAEEQDQDLGLLVILVSGVAGGSESEEKIKEALFARFKDRDYIFQYKSQGAAVITPGASIEEALEQAEDLYAAFRKTARITEGMAIGISTRTGRVIPAARLISEADEAARRAEQNSETPIVALRINPEKYREYLGSAK